LSWEAKIDQHVSESYKVNEIFGNNPVTQNSDFSLALQVICPIVKIRWNRIGVKGAGDEDCPHVFSDVFQETLFLAGQKLQLISGRYWNAKGKANFVLRSLRTKSAFEGYFLLCYVIKYVTPY